MRKGKEVLRLLFELGLGQRQIARSCGMGWHSDRGVRYALGEWVAILGLHQMLPSMSRPANPSPQCGFQIRHINGEHPELQVHQRGQARGDPG
jgi:hypothetical protein